MIKSDSPTLADEPTKDKLDTNSVLELETGGEMEEKPEDYARTHICIAVSRGSENPDLLRMPSRSSKFG